MLTDDDKAWLRQEHHELRQELEAKIEAVETKLLTAFHQWASPMEARQRSHSAALRALDEEMESLDARMKKLETPE